MTSIATAPQVQKQHNQVSFKGGLTRICQRSIGQISPETMAGLSKSYSHSNGNIGHIPQEMIRVFKSLNPKTVGESVKKIQAAFCEVANLLRNNKNGEATSALQDIAKKTGLIPKDGQAKLEYLSSGGFGSGYKVSFQDARGKDVIKPLCLKTYSEDGEALNNQIFNFFEMPLENIQEKIKLVRKRFAIGMRMISPAMLKQLKSIGID